METPDKWIVVKIGDKQPIFKVFATWYGGYTDGDSWKMNSGIVRTEVDGNYINFYGYSGSCYKCNKNNYGTSMYSQNIINRLIENFKKDVSITILQEETDWENLIK